MFQFLRQRSYQPEIMDDGSIESSVIVPVLKELDFINKVLGGYRITKNALHQIGIEEGDIIADWGCGGGDTLKQIDHWCYSQNLPIRMVGLDFSQEILRYAAHSKQWHYHVDWICDDALKFQGQQQFNIVHSCLFLHHFTDEQLVKMLRQMHDSCTRAVIINDLHRHWLAYYSIQILTRIFSKSEMVKNDAPLSVARGFKKSDLKRILESAGLNNYSIRWFWAFRWQVIIKRNDA